MLGINLKHSLATVTVAAGLLATAGSASAGAHQPGIIYNGHAGLGASVYQHNQTDLDFAGVTDGTSNTMMFGERAAAPRGFSIDIGTSENLILMADMGGQFHRYAWLVRAGGSRAR